MSTDILYPILIGVACLVLVVVVHLITRPKPSRSDITVPGAHSRLPENSVEPSALDLEEWHQTHEATLLTFIEHYDHPNEKTDDAALSDSFETALSSHPAPEMRAELAALRAAAEAMTSATERGDTEAIVRHNDVYRTYRYAWLERLWQFPVDADRVGSVRNRPQTNISDDGDTPPDNPENSADTPPDSPDTPLGGIKNSQDS